MIFDREEYLKKIKLIRNTFEVSQKTVFLNTNVEFIINLDELIKYLIIFFDNILSSKNKYFKENFSSLFINEFLLNDVVKCNFERLFSLYPDNTIWKLQLSIINSSKKNTNLFVPYIVYCMPRMCKLFNLQLEKIYLPPYITVNRFCLLSNSDTIYSIFFKQGKVHAAIKELTFNPNIITKILESDNFRKMIKIYYKIHIKGLDFLLPLILSFIN